MRSANSALKINPGGALTLSEVIGRDSLADSLWDALDRQSVLLTAERRMGKTSLLLKLEAEPAPATCVIKRTVQGVRSHEEFAKLLVADVERALPGRLKRSLGAQLAAAGIKKIASRPISVEFRPADERSWKEVVVETFAVLDEEVDERVVILWDELPLMIADIAHDHGPGPAREVLDVLRAVRETHPGVRMVLSGSKGIHHVVDELRPAGSMWVPDHDMHPEDLPPLHHEDAVYLAGQLLANEGIGCDDLDTVAETIAAEVDDIPFYVHKTALRLRTRQQSGELGQIDRSAVAALIEAAIADPLDPWQLGHYVDRTASYYGEQAPIVNRALDHIAGADREQSLEQIEAAIAAHERPPSEEALHSLMTLLCRDYYLREGPAGYSFLRELVRRSWIAKRP